MEKKDLFPKQSYSWFLSTYARPEEYQRIIDHAKHWALCFHDKDLKEDGTTKEPHTHILCTFEQRISLQKIQDIIKSDQNTLGENGRIIKGKYYPLNFQGCFDYLIHAQNPDKYQYEDIERVIDDEQYWKRYKKQADVVSDNITFIEDITKAYTSEYDFLKTCAEKYGRDFIRNMNVYKDFRYKYNIAEIEQEKIKNIKEDNNDFLQLAFKYKEVIYMCEGKYITPIQAKEIIKQHYDFDLTEQSKILRDRCHEYINKHYNKGEQK